MKTQVVSLLCAVALLGGATTAFAGAYGEAQQPEEMPIAPPPVLTPPAPLPEPELVLREFAGFLTDAETSRGFWAELGSVYASETDLGPDQQLVNTFLHLSYGQKLWEVGGLFPYLYYDVDDIGSDNGFGDITLWGKVIPLRTDRYQLGGGLLVTFPTGENSFSTDEYGFEPFVTGAVAAGPVSLRGSFGYMTSTGDPNDALDTEFAVLAPIGESVVLRGELLWYHQDDIDPVTFAPGVDIRFALNDNLELLLRPTAGVGFTEEAPDWQIGLSFALTQIAG